LFATSAIFTLGKSKWKVRAKRFPRNGFLPLQDAAVWRAAEASILGIALGAIELRASRTLDLAAGARSEIVQRDQVPDRALIIVMKVDFALADGMVGEDFHRRADPVAVRVRMAPCASPPSSSHGARLARA
jgi:hypothetical protein